jgi:O-antigen/teichoic acid export membrane protein
MIEKLGTYSFSNLIRNRPIQNFVFLATIQASNVLISLITIPLLIQSIGVDQFGLVNLALSIIVLFNILVGFGYNLSGPREVAINHQDKKALSHLVSNIVFSKILMALIATLCIILAVFAIGMFREYQWILLFSVLLLFSEATLPLWFFQGMEKMKVISVANVFGKLLYLMGIILFIHSPQQSIWVNFLMGLSGLIINLLLLLYIHFQMDIRFYKPKFLQVFDSIKENGLFFLSNMAGHISINGGLIILSFFSTAAILGMFSLAERISMVLRLFPSLVIQSIYPNASRLFLTDKNRFFSFLKKSYLVTLILGLLGSLLTFGFAPFIIQLLAKSYLEESIQFMRILAFVPFFAALNIPNVMVFLVKDQKSLMFRSSWMSTLYMLPACSLLTYYYGGLGLCFGLLSTELIILAICTILNFSRNRTDVVAFWKSIA